MIKFYNAGAGAGKTHTLSNELANFLIEGNGKPAEVILTTFSKKSAEELKERVRRSLLEKGQPAKAAAMSNALIGTVNAVCSQLVGKYAMEAGFSPELRVLDEAAMKLFFNEFVNGAINDTSFQRLQLLCTRFSLFEKRENGGFNQRDNLKPDWPNMVKQLASRFRAYNFNAADVERSKQEAIKVAGQFLLTNPTFTTSAIWDKVENSINVLLQGITAKKDIHAIEGLEKLKSLSSNKAKIKWEDYALAGTEIANNTSKNNPWFAELVLSCREHHRCPEFANEYIDLISLVYDTAYMLIEDYQTYKQERGLIDFADQELLFLDMIKTNPVVQAEIKATFKLVMVDEFQDSSPVQLAIFTSLQQLVADAIWVGDPKQAIYGFRDSDSELFNLALNAVKKDSSTVTESLPYSFRSRPAIVHVVNDIFTGLFKGILEKEHIVLTASVKAVEVEARCNGYSAPAVQAQFYNETKIENYYASIGAYVKEVLKSGMQVYDKKIDTFRNIRGKDIALLFRTNPAIKQAAAEMKQQGIAVSCEADGLQQQAETLWISCLLRLLVNINDSLAIANLALMEGAVEGIDALLTDRLNFIDAEVTEQRKWIDHSHVAKMIAGQQRLLAQMPLVQALPHLITISELPCYCVQWGNAGQRMSNINKMVEMAGVYEQQCAIMGLAASFAGFIGYFSDMDALPPSDTEDAVTLMTVHKAKGLEWPMVVIVKLDPADDDCKVLFNTIHVKQPAAPDYNNLLFGQTIVYLPWPFGSTKKIEKVSSDLLESRAILETNLCAFDRFFKEEDRLLYVALTRARDYLILPYNKKTSGSCIENFRQGNMSDLFSAAHWETLKGNATEILQQVELQGHEISVRSFPTYVATEPTTEEARPLLFYNTGKRVEEILHSNRFINPSKLSQEIPKATVNLLDYQLPLLPLNNLKDISYADFGSGIHNAFACWKKDSEKQIRTGLIKELMQRMQLDGHIDATELDERFDYFWNFIQTNYAPSYVIKEVPLIEVTENNGTITSGIADCILHTDKGLVLIDHKTFPGHFESMAMNPEHEQYAGKYAGQLQLYRQLIEKATGQKVIAMLLHYVVQGRIVEVVIAGN